MKSNLTSKKVPSAPDSLNFAPNPDETYLSAEQNSKYEITAAVLNIIYDCFFGADDCGFNDT